MAQWPTLSIQQRSVFKLLPAELILEIFDHLDILSIFRFLDTCRYHRHLLLHMPAIWRIIRFIPLTDFEQLASRHPTPTAVMAVPATTSQLHAPVPYRKRPQRPLIRNTSRSSSSSSSTSSSDEEGEESEVEADADADTKVDNSNHDSIDRTTTHRLKHAENERDKDRGGGRSLISEVYAVLRRFRKENGLVDYVKEIYMDATDSPQFPSPLVMLVKFPHLQKLSSRYRRKQTSLTTDTHTLKDMLRNGDFMPHSLQLRRWNVFHPYMTKEDVTGFKQILDAIAVVGVKDIPSGDKDQDQAADMTRETSGVLLDIRLCPGLERPPINDATPGAQIGGAPAPTSVPPPFQGGGMHWARPTAAVAATTTTSTATPIEPCSNIVWELEKCRVCDAPQERCWRCVGQCSACNAIRAPPYINHQTILERERTRHTSGTNAAPTLLNSQGRPRTPPGSISLSQLSNPLQEIRSAYVLTQAAIPSILCRPPEFSFFD